MHCLAYPSADTDQVGPDFSKLGSCEGQHEDRHLLHPLHEVLDEVEKQGVGPLDVVGDDDQRSVARQHLDVPAQRPKGLLDRSGNSGRQAVEVAQDAVPFGSADGDIGFEIAGAQHLDDRCEGDGPLDVAPRLDHPDITLGPSEFRRQSGLADARIADHRDQPGGLGSDRVVERCGNPPDLVAPADEGSGVGRLRLAAKPPVHRNGCGPALHLHLTERFVPVSAARRPPRLLSDNDVAARTLGLEPGRDVQGVANEVGVACPDHDLTGVHRDTQGKFDPVQFCCAGGKVDEALLQLDRGVDGAACVVSSHLGNTPDGHEPVADVLCDARPVALRGRRRTS